MLDATQVLVTLVGLGLMGFVAWFFLSAPHQAGGAPATGGGQPAEGQAAAVSAPPVKAGQPVVE